ncbi:hypothetical protein [Salegentibacter salegens]|uniref:DUF4132 domain-containing protein n=1 Tax=Salegentibacter salegens TaxID=143223 RepID=A0A1M7J8G5_9FLAO|nr:hypothetical protein [Salegentibacter salegens]PRX47316.1 hypothetical protein LY58_01406 [Salegentibacter salegens]SHM49306.1 hypothetical protein SAMN05878281_0859 [Salegentibacter salegens]
MSEHYFFKKSNIWQFFHNSFKEFLVEETSKDFFSDEIDEQLDIDFHLKIYEGIKNLNNDEYRWNIIYHLFQAKKFDLITELTSQDYFRQQWYEYRNTTYIQEDINLTALASSYVKKPKSLLICSLSEYELRQRTNNFTPSLYYETFHQLSMIDVANSFIYNNVELLVEKEVALDYCIALFKQGLKKLSFEIFLKAEPTFILKNIKQVSPRKRTNNSVYEIDQIQLVKKWAKASSLFNPIDDILAKLKGFEVLKEFPVDENRDVLIESISEILQFRIDENDWDGISELHEKVKHIIPNEYLFTFYFEVVWYLENENNFYEHCKSQLSKWVLKNDSPANLRLGLFEVIINDNVKGGKLAFEKTAHPLEKKVNSSSMNLAGSFNYIFNYSRLYYLLYKDFSKDTAQFLPEFKNTNLKAFCNEYAELGKSYAYIFLKKENASIQFCFRMKQIFNYFHNHITDRGHEYAIHENKADIIILILRLSTEVSDELLNRLLSEISVEWENNLRYWGESKQQEVIEWVIESGRNDEWCIDNLRRLNKSIFQDGYNTDRIEKGVSQIKLWSILGRIDEGKKILETLMEISLDVRGEKDDQIDYLVEWLGKFKEIDSDELKFYLEKLDSIYQKVNSASHTPAMEILRYSLNKGNGFEIFKYVLMEGLVGLNDGIEILLEHILKKLPEKKNLLVSLYIRTVIAFDNIYYGRGSFLNNLLHYDLSTSEINKIVKDLKVYSILEHRNDYLNKIKKYSIKKNIDLQKIGIDDVIVKEKRDTSSYLSLKGGTTYSKDEAIQTIKNYHQLVESINGEEEHGYFKWISIIEKLSPNLSLVQLEELLKIKKFDGIDLLKFAEIFHSKGDLDKTKQLIEEALAQSTLNSWSEVYDNGLKIKAYTLYHKIEDKEIVQDKAVKDFLENFKIDHESVIARYDSIFSLMFDEIQIEDLYTEINNYKNQLLKSHFTTEGTPPINGNLSTEELLYQTIIFLMEIPCRFDDIINEILLENIDQNKGLITVLLNRLFEEQYYDSFIKLIASISLKETRFLQSFTTEIAHLLNHERFDIHNIAIRVMDRMDLNVGEFYKVKTKREPLAYTLKLNKRGGLIIPEKDRIERVDRKGFLPETDNPLEYVWLYESELKLLSEQTDYDLINLATRVKQLSQNKVTPGWYKFLSEEELRDLFDNKFRVKTTYLRPRTQSVINGMMIVLKELVELRKIDRDLAEYISNIFDEAMYYIKPQEKPKFIKSILNNDNYAPSANEKWAHELTDDYVNATLKSLVYKDLIVLAESTKIKGQGDGYTSENRQSFIDRFDTPIKSNLIFSRIFKCYYENYEFGEVTNNICYFNWLMTFNKKRNWLAFNAELAEYMGLHLSSQGNFRWLNNKGDIVVESVYWQSGEEYNNNRNLHSDSGSGWIVVITKEGFELLKHALGNVKLYQHKRIERKLKFYQSKYGTYINEKDDNYKVTQIDF